LQHRENSLLSELSDGALELVVSMSQSPFLVETFYPADEQSERILDRITAQ
jgi:hypothetical protein